MFEFKHYIISMSWSSTPHNFIGSVYKSSSMSLDSSSRYFVATDSHLCFYDSELDTQYQTITISFDGENIQPYSEMFADGKAVCFRTLSQVYIYTRTNNVWSEYATFDINADSTLVIDKNSYLAPTVSLTFAIDNKIYQKNSVDLVWTEFTIDGEVKAIYLNTCVYVSSNETNIRYFTENQNGDTIVGVAKKVYYQGDYILYLDQSDKWHVYNFNDQLSNLIILDNTPIVLLDNIVVNGNNYKSLIGSSLASTTFEDPILAVSATRTGNGSLVIFDNVFYVNTTFKMNFYSTHGKFSVTITVNNQDTTKISEFDEGIHSVEYEFGVTPSEAQIKSIIPLLESNEVNHSVTVKRITTNMNGGTLSMNLEFIPNGPIGFVSVLAVETDQIITFSDGYSPITIAADENMAVLDNFKVYLDNGDVNTTTWTFGSTTGIIGLAAMINLPTIIDIQWSIDRYENGMLYLNCPDDTSFTIGNQIMDPFTKSFNMTGLTGNFTIVPVPTDDNFNFYPLNILFSIVDWQVSATNQQFTITLSDNIPINFKIDETSFTNSLPNNNSTIQVSPLINGYHVIRTEVGEHIYTNKTSIAVFINPTFTYNTTTGISINYQPTVTGNYEDISYVLNPGNLSFTDATENTPARINYHELGNYTVVATPNNNAFYYSANNSVTITETSVVNINLISYVGSTGTLIVGAEGNIPSWNVQLFVDDRQLTWNSDHTVATLTNYRVPGDHTITFTAPADVTVEPTVTFNVHSPVTVTWNAEYNIDTGIITVNIPDNQLVYNINFTANNVPMNWNDTHTVATLLFSGFGSCTIKCIGYEYYVIPTPIQQYLSIAPIHVSVADVITHPNTVVKPTVTISPAQATYQLIVPTELSSYFKIIGSNRIQVLSNTPVNNYTLRCEATLGIKSVISDFTVKVRERNSTNQIVTIGSVVALLLGSAFI